VTPSRPKNLNLLTIHFPLPAIISILHRITGVFLLLLIPLALWGLDVSLTESGFTALSAWFASFYIKALWWILLIPFCFHLIAGVRHLLADIHVGDTLPAGKWSAWLVLVIAALVILLIGIWIW